MNEMQPRIRVGHSPDSDDAFMFHGMVNGKIDTAGLRIEQIHQDIETLNRRALEGELELTAVSVHAYAYLHSRYRILRCGASMGDGYGPRVVARKPLTREQLRRVRIAVPGRMTSAFLALALYLEGEFEHEVVPFDGILDDVAGGRFEAGLVIHEGQLTYGDQDLHRVVDLGEWWGAGNDGLPLPLGANAVRRDLDEATTARVYRALRDSIDYGLGHREEAIRYAETFGRGLDRARTDAFVGMYVNEWTQDLGERGCEAVQRFLDQGHEAGLLPERVVAEFVGP
ncbi:MAG: ABC transporter substrate-binding protein [Acidobacteriota bacterium]|jgi:1,4-dihydroxy-6-naphthoate synthase